MKKFLAIYMAPIDEMQKMMAETTPEARKAGMGEWMQWMQAHKANIADNGAPLGKTKQIMASGVSDIRNEMGGYTIIQAESHEEAAKMFMDNPHLKMVPSARVELMEIMEMPGM